MTYINQCYPKIYYELFQNLKNVVLCVTGYVSDVTDKFMISLFLYYLPCSTRLLNILGFVRKYLLLNLELFCLNLKIININ